MQNIHWEILQMVLASFPLNDQFSLSSSSITSYLTLHLQLIHTMGCLCAHHANANQKTHGIFEMHPQGTFSPIQHPQGQHDQNDAQISATPL